jgi:G3E family GTPase
MRRLAELNATAPVLIAQHGQIAPRDLLSGRLYDPLTRSLDVQSWLGANPDAQDHHHGIETYALVRFEPLRAVTLTLFLEAIAEHCGADLLRLKGIMNILESPERPAVIHGVQHAFHPPNWLRGWPSDDRRSRMIFITRGIPRGWIEALLAALDAEVAAVSRGTSM